ncbi:MAG: hypothetical protein ACTSXU_16725 [Promethearchaeota archaeon]
MFSLSKNDRENLILKIKLIKELFHFLPVKRRKKKVSINEVELESLFNNEQLEKYLAGDGYLELKQ